MHSANKDLFYSKSSLDYSDLTTDNDIVLLQLASEIQYNDFILPICLPTQNEDVPSGTLCWITGWGNTESM